MITVDPWEKAADCERALDAAADPDRHAMLERVRDLWIALGNEQSLMTDEELAEGVQAINRMHVEWTAAGRA